MDAQSDMIRLGFFLCRLCDNRIVYIGKEFDLCPSQAIDLMSIRHYAIEKKSERFWIFFVCFAPGKDSAHWSDIFSLVPNSPLFQFLFSIFSAQENWFFFLRRKINEESKTTHSHYVSAFASFHPFYASLSQLEIHAANCCFANRF